MCSPDFTGLRLTDTFQLAIFLSKSYRRVLKIVIFLKINGLHICSGVGTCPECFQVVFHKGTVFYDVLYCLDP